MAELDMYSLVERSIRNREERLQKLILMGMQQIQAQRQMQQQALEARQRALMPKLWEETTGEPWTYGEATPQTMEMLIRGWQTGQRKKEEKQETQAKLSALMQENERYYKQKLPSEFQTWSPRQQLNYILTATETPRKLFLQKEAQRQQWEYSKAGQGIISPPSVEQQRIIKWGGSTRQAEQQKVSKEEAAYIQAKQGRDFPLLRLDDLNRFYNRLISQADDYGYLYVTDVGEISRQIVNEIKRFREIKSKQKGMDIKPLTENEEASIQDRLNTLGQIYLHENLQFELINKAPTTTQEPQTTIQPETSVENLVSRAEQGDVSAYKRLKELGYIK